MADFIYIDGVEYKPDKELIDLIKSHAPRTKLAVINAKFIFNRNSEFRLVNGQPKFDINGYDLAVSLWNTRARIIDNGEDVD